MRSLLLLTLLLSALSLACGQISYYAFCFTATQTNQNSPTLPWAVSMSGTIGVNMSAGALTQGYFSGYYPYFSSAAQQTGYGYPVLTATGTRSIYSMNQPVQTLTITGVAPVNTYNGNDNIIRTTAPYFDNVAHSITFTLSGQPQFALGMINTQGVVQGNPSYVNMMNYTTPMYGGAGVQESDDPPNDGNANVLVSTFTLTPSTSFSASVTCPTSITAPAAAPSTFASTLTWSFCYTFTGGGNFATVNGQQWFITGSGTITTTAYAGTTLNGRTAYLITGMSGTRTYTNAGTGTSQTTNIIGVGGPNTQQAVDYKSEQFAWLEFNGLEADLSNNLLYTNYPYFDQWGVSVITDSFIGNEDQNNLTVNAFRLWVDPGSYSFNEWVTDLTAGYWYFTYSANAIIVPSSTSTAAALLPQCSPTYGSTVYFQFCYYIDNIGQPNSTFTYAYGTITATGPVYRNGRMAYTAQTINGVHSTTVNGVLNTSAIIYLEWIQSDLNWGFINNNLIYTTTPYIDQQGLIYATSSGPVFANGAVPANTEVYYGYTDIFVGSNNYGNVSLTTVPGIYEQSVLTPQYITNGSTSSAFNVAMMSGPGVPSTATCAYTGANSQYITPIATTQYSFCYVVNGADNGGWRTYAQGTITTYNTVIMNGGLPAYAIQNITGTRTYQAPAASGGGSSTVTITGINSNNQGADGWVYDNLLYASAPFLDSDGLVYNFAGTANTVNGPVSGDGVATINMFIYTGFFQEEYYTTTNFAVYGDVVGMTSQSFNVQADGGAAANAGTYLQSGCGLNPTSSYATVTTTFGFCYAISNNLATSPYLPWAVVTTGTFTVVTNSLSTGLYQQSAEYPGYLITGGSGTRTVYSATMSSPQSQTINVLPVNSYNTNDNILQPTSVAYGGVVPAYPLVSLHGISFTTGSSPVLLPQGTVTGIYGPLNNLTLVGWQSPSPPSTGGSMPITEADLPLNDGVTGNVVGYMQVNYNGASAPSCTGGSTPIQLPTYSASVASQISSTLQYQFCYYFTGVDNLGTNWSIATSGTFTTSGFLGTTTTGQSARLITAASGQRVLTVANGTQFVTPLLGLGGFNAYQFQAENTNNEQFSSYFSSNNILYMNWPYFDSYGVSLQGSTNFWEPNGEGLNTGNTALKLFIDPATYDVAEWLLDWAQNVYYVGEAGTLQVSPASSVSNTANFYAQCSPSYGTSVTYQWCYYEDRSTSATNPFYVQAYGSMVLNGPVTRQGRQAYSIQSMTGVRSYTNVATGAVSSNPILALQYINYDEGYGGGSGLTFWVNNDNYVFTSSPPLTTNGFIYGTFPTPNNPQFPQGINTVSGDIQVNVNTTSRYSASGLALQENGVGSESTSTNAASLITQASNFGFVFTQGGLSSTSQCSSQSSRFQYPQLITYSFCYYFQGTANNNFTVATAGTITVYNINVTSNLQYPNTNATIIAGITGYRQYIDGMGNNSYITITGLGSNWYAEEGWDYDQLLYGNSARFDDYGLLYTFTGTAQSPMGPVYGDRLAPAINIFSDGTNFQEEGWYGQFTNAFDLGSGGSQGAGGVFRLAQDGGSSYSSGSLLRNQCGYSGAFPNTGSGSSGLSGGAIAGIVIGSVVGALLLCMLCFFIVLKGSGGKRQKSVDDTPTKGHSQLEESRVEHSQVELADGNTSTD